MKSCVWPLGSRRTAWASHTFWKRLFAMANQGDLPEPAPRAPNEMSVEPICERRRGGCAKRARSDLTESIVEGERQSSRPTPAAKRPTVLILLGALSLEFRPAKFLPPVLLEPERLPSGQVGAGDG